MGNGTWIEKVRTKNMQVFGKMDFSFLRNDKIGAVIPIKTESQEKLGEFSKKVKKQQIRRTKRNGGYYGINANL